MGKNELFKIGGNISLWKLIMGYFNEKSTGGTVRLKAHMGARFIDAAQAYSACHLLYGEDLTKNIRLERKTTNVGLLLRRQLSQVRREVRRRKAFSKKEASSRDQNR